MVLVVGDGGPGRGRGEELVAGGDDRQPGVGGGAGAGRVRDDGVGVPRLRVTGGAGGADHRVDGGPGHRRHGRAGAGREAGARRRSSSSRCSPRLEQEVRDAYAKLAGEAGNGNEDEASFAVRSSATAEDLPDASFAGQQETFLNIRGIESVLTAIREVFASLYNDRAIAYRVHHGFEHADVALSAGVQRMVRSDVGASGVMFTMDTESGFTDAVFVTASYGLGEAVVQGAVNPDEWYVWKPGLAAGHAGGAEAGRGWQGHEDGVHRRPERGQDDGVRRRRPGGAGAVLADRRGGRGAGSAGGLDRGALRPADGHRVGQGR